MQLCHWSDVAYLQWLEVWGGTTPKPIRYVIRSTITKNGTRDVLWKILKNRRIEGYTQWPGVVLGTETNAGKAILGKASDAGTAYMLIQRKAELGNRKIGNIAVFLGNDGGMEGKTPSLCFWIE